MEMSFHHSVRWFFLRVLKKKRQQTGLKVVIAENGKLIRMRAKKSEIVNRFTLTGQFGFH
jgi:hypothetical protein